MNDLLKYLEQVGTSTISNNSTPDPRPAQKNARDILESFDAARRERETSYDVEEFAKRTQGAIEQASNLISERSNARAVGDVAAGVASGVYGTVTGGLNLFLNPEAINALRAPLEMLENAKSPQARNQMEHYNRETALYNKTIENAVMEGRISSFDGQVLIAKNSFKSMNAGTAEAYMSSGAGSVGFLIGMSAFGGPVGAAAAWTAMGASSLAAPVDTVLSELYSEESPGVFKYTHEDLMDSSPVYQKAFEETGSEEEARRAVFNEARTKSVLSWENLGGTLIELFGERLLLRMSGVLKSARQIGGITAIPKNLTKATVGESVAEVTGDTGSTIGANVGIQETFDKSRDRLAGVGENIPGAVIGSIGGVATASPGTVLTGVVNTLAGDSDSTGSKKLISDSEGLTQEISNIAPPTAKGGNVPEAENDIVSKLRNVQELYNTGGGKELPESLREIAGAEQSRIRQIVSLYEHVASGKATPEETIEIGKVLQEYSADLDAATNELGDPNQIEDADQARIIQAAIKNRDQILNDNKNLEAAVQKATELVASREVQKDESGKLTKEGTKTVSDKLALAPESLTREDVEAALEMLPDFSDSDRAKLKFIRDSLNKQRELDQQRADAGMNQPIDVVGREVLSEYGEGSKGKSVLGHATSIMDSMRAGRTSDAKAQMGTLRRFIASHTNKLNALEKAVAEGSNKATYRTYNKALNKGVNTTIEVKGKAQNLRRAVAQELAFMTDVYNRLVDAYKGLGNPITPPEIVNTVFTGSSEADTRTSQEKVTEPRKPRVVSRMTPESVQQMSSSDVYRQFQNLEATANRNFNQESDFNVLRDEIARREKAVMDSIQPIEQVEAMSRPEQRAYLSTLRTIPEAFRSDELAAHIADVVDVLNRPDPAPQPEPEAAPAPATPEPTEAVEKVKSKFEQLDLDSSERLISSMGTVVTKLYDGSISPGELALLEQRINAYLNKPTSPSKATPTAAPEATSPSGTNTSNPEKPVRNEADQKEMEESYPGILPWETLEEYEQRTREEPTSEPDTETEAQPTAESQSKTVAERIFGNTKIAKAVNIAAEKTRIYTENFMNSLVRRFREATDAPTKTYGDYLVQQRTRISEMLGAYDEVGNPTPGSLLHSIHTAMDGQLLYNLDSSPSKLKILENLIRPYIGKQDIREWMNQNMPKPAKNTAAGREQGRRRAEAAIKSVLAQGMDEASVNRAMNQFKADILARNRTHRMLDLMSYDPETNRFTLDNRVMNAAALALTDYIGNFRNYAETYQEPNEIAKALGATESNALTYEFIGEQGSLTVEQLSTMGYSTFRRAVANVSSIANAMLGMRGKSTAGDGDINSPMQNLIGTLMENMGESSASPLSFVSVRVTNDNGVTFPILIPVSTPEEGSQLSNLMQAGDLGNRSTLVEPERIRYVNTVPPKKTTDKQGNRLTKKQQDALEVANNVAFRANPKTFNLFTRVLGRVGMLRAFGNPDALDDNVPMSRLDRESKNGKNIQVLNSLQELHSLENEITAQGGNLTETPVYYSHAYSSVTRLMMEGGYNPQADKIIRAVMSPHGTTIDASGFIEHLASGSMADASNVNRFLTIAYAQALGVSIQNRTMDQIHQDLNKILDSEMREIAGEWAAAASQATETDLSNLIDRTKEKLGGDFTELAVQTLVEIGDILAGNNTSNFTTHAYVEADGITNGPFMAGMILGIQQFSPDWVRFTSNGGLYIGREETSNDYRSGQIANPNASRPDNYTAVTQEANVLVEKALRFFHEGGNNQVKQAIKSIRDLFKHGLSSPVINAGGQIEIARNVGKNPVTVTFYGSGLTGIASKFANEVAQGIYEIATAALQSSNINEFAESVIKGDLSTEQKVEALKNLLNAFDYLVNGRIGMKEGVPYYSTNTGTRLNLLGRFNTNKESLVNLRLTKEQLENLQANLKPTLVDPLVTSLQSLAGSTLQGTEVVQRSTSAFSDLLAAVFQKEVSQLISNPDFDPTVGLSRKDIQGIIDKLKAFGITDTIGDSLFSLITQEGAIPGLEIPLDTIRGSGLHHMESSYKNLTNIGVGGIPRFVISRGDGATIVEFFNRALEQGVTTPLAIFDGINLGVNEFETGSKLANESVLHSIMQNPVQGLSNQIEKGMYPMLEELGFEIGPDSSVSVQNGEEIKALVDTLTERIGNKDVAESIVLRGLKNAIPGLAQDESVKLSDFADKTFDEPIILVPRVARSIQDLQKLIKTDAELEIWKAIHPFMRVFEDVEHLQSVKKKYDDIYLEHPEGIGSIFSTASIKLLANRVTENLDTLKKFKFSVDQMAGVGQPAVNDGISLDSKDFNEISQALQAESKKAKEDAFAGGKEYLFRMNTRHWQKNADGSMTLTDYAGFRELLARSFPEGDFRSNVANRVVRMLKALEIEIVVDPKAYGPHFSPETNRVILTNNSSTAALHEIIHGAITQTIHDKYIRGKKMRPAVERAFADLEAIMNELINDPNAILSPVWNMAITHMVRAGNRTRAVWGARAATGSMINEMLAIWLTNPTLAADAMSRPPKSKLRKLGEAVLNLFRNTFGLKQDDKVDSLFMRMAYSMDVLARDAVRSLNEVTEGSEPSLDMFDPNGIGMSQPLYREFMDVVNQAEAQLRQVDRDLTLKRDLESVDSADIFKANGFYMDANQEKAFNQLREVFTVSAKVNPEVKSNLYRLASHILRNIKPEHFGDVSQPGSPSYHVAHNKHAAVTGSASGSREAMVVNLLALASVNPEMQEVLNQIGMPQAEKSSETESTWERVLGQAGYDAMNKLSNYLSGTRKGEVPTELLSRLMESVEKKPEGESNKIWTLPGQLIDQINDKTSDLLTDLGNYIGGTGQNLIRNSNSRAATISGGILGAVGAALSKDSAMGFAEQMNSVFNSMDNFNFLKDTMRDIIGRTDLNASVYDLIKVVRSHVQRLRQMYIEGVETNIKKKFKTAPSQEQMNSLQRTLAETDSAAIVGSLGLDKAIDILSDDNKVTRRIRQLESIINRNPDSAFLIEKSKQLAKYLTTGETGSMLLLNATHIAGKFGHEGSAESIEAVDANLVNVIDEYVSLLAFQDSDKETFRQLLQTEPEAVRYIMAILDGIRKDEMAKPGAFGKPIGIKGYIPSRSAGSIKIIRDDMAEQYVNKGYVRVGDYEGTHYDNKNIKRGYYVNMLDEARPFAQGIIQNVVASHNGLTINDDPLSENLIPTGFDIETIENIIADGIQNTSKFGLVPIFDENGNVVNLVRAIDPAVAREKNSNNDFAANLGKWRGRQIEESTAEQINRVIVDELESAYNKDTKKGEYVNLLNLNTDDPVVKDALSILNKEAIRYSKDTYGRMMVRKELLNNVIGYRQAGVADIWNGISRLKPETRRQIQRALETMIGPKAFKYMVQGENALRGLVADAKQLIVVKSVVIPAVNGLSNILHMMARGVPLQSIVRGIPRKLAEIEQYSQGMKRIIEIESEILASSEPAQIRRLEAERSSILEHHRSLSIYPLIESGEFASIVSVQIDQESGDLNKGKIAEYLESKINQLPSGGRTLANNLLISKNTAIYQFLQKSVDYGDFIAKAIIFDDIVQRQKRSPQYALGRIKEEFINYDYLPGRVRGALEANGLLWFFNFKLRSLKIALSMIRENPITALMTVGAVPMSTPVGNLGLPLDDNILSQTFTGAVGYSIGPEMGINSAMLHPLSAVIFK
ncbi:virion RNA polymerase [Pseudomonas phage ZC08]|uniref:Virion DNA-directed RNA polymerase n=1 Tax=Pseudomonas phage ZC08 TaxID=1622116 RepID=A0A1L2C9F7_9CAUD|nr:virion RNA polymerase [Pseudomonas phage ZC08]AMD43541.1 virion DNA-directed RNA polymerase [Pseudomonas phage ZC08]